MADACRDTGTDLTVEEAYAILEPYFLAVQERFVAEGAGRTGDVQLEVAPWAHDAPRHFAATATTGSPVVVAPELAELPEETVLAILAHEFGHAVDYLYPGEYVLVDDGELELVRLPPTPAHDLGGQRGEQAYLARMRRWEHRDDDTVERTADAIAEYFTGHAIGYCGPCSLQCFDRGVSRPKGLR
jgi:hypothetical protein